MPGRRRPDGADVIVAALVAGEHGRAFGDAVALQDVRAVRGPQLACRSLHALGAGDDLAQACELARLGGADVAGEERVGRQQQRGLAALDQSRDLAVVQRARIEDDLHAGKQGREGGRRQPEGMEHRQRVQEDLLGAEDGPHVIQHLAGVGDQVEIGQHDALGRALGAGGEEDDGGIVRAPSPIRG